MTWFRANIRLGSRLALIALAIQLALNFGHAHRVDHPAAALELADAADHRSDAPSSDHPEAGCGICAVTALAGAALPAPAPTLAAPPSGDGFARTAVVERLALAPVRGAFQPRAPPLS